MGNAVFQSTVNIRRESASDAAIGTLFPCMTFEEQEKRLRRLAGATLELPLLAELRASFSMVAYSEGGFVEWFFIIK
jgi:hypothetical protein